jgi:hypothetical protein
MQYYIFAEKVDTTQFKYAFIIAVITSNIDVFKMLTAKDINIDVNKEWFYQVISVYQHEIDTRHLGTNWKQNFMMFAAYTGSIDAVIYGRLKNYPLSKWMTSYAAKNGKYSTLEFLHKVGCEWGQYTMQWAAQNEHIKCLKFAYEHGCPIDPSLTSAVIYKGRMQSLQFMLETDLIEKSTNVINSLIEYGHYRCVEWALKNNFPVGKRAYEIAARFGNLSFIQLLHKYAVPWDYRLTKTATKHEHLHILEYAHKNGCPLPTIGLEIALQKNNNGIIKFYHTNGVKLKN